jgi:competence protein ComEC
MFMALVAILAQGSGRTYDVTRALVFAAFMMVLWNPMTLMFNPGFQLSFLATAGLIYISPLISPFFSWISNKIKLRETIVSTLAAQLAVLPLILYSSGQLSLVALPVNILMLPGIPITMFLGTVTAGLAFISHYVALPVGWATYLFLHFQLSLVHFSSRLPYAEIYLPFPFWFMVVIYLIALGWLLYSSLRSRSS